MKSINHFTSKRNSEKNLLHVETEGCLVNIRVGLTDDNGREVTNISIRPDRFAGERAWYVVDEQGNRLEHAGLRVVRETEKEFENRRAYERMIERRESKLMLKDLRLDAGFSVNLLTFKDRTSESPYTVAIMRERGYKTSPDKYRVYVHDRLEFYMDGIESIKNTIKGIYDHINYWDGTLVDFLLNLDVCEKCLGRGDYACPICEEWYAAAPSIASDEELETYKAHFAMDKCEYGRLGCEECNGLGFKK